MQTQAGNFEQWRGRLRDFCTGMAKSVRRRVESSDIVQDVCLQIVEQYDGDVDAVGEGYLIVAARGHAAKTVRYHRQQCRSTLSEAALQDTSGNVPSPDAILAKREDAALLANAMNQLDEDLQRIVFLRAILELSFREIAEALGQTERVVGLSFKRALEQLKRLLREDDLR